MPTVTTAVKVKITNPETRDVLYTGSHAQRIINAYTDNWHKLSDLFIYHNPLISYSPMANLFYITYELHDDRDFVRTDFAVTMSCPKYIEINKKNYQLSVEIM
jgi:hypothetical protein